MLTIGASSFYWVLRVLPSPDKRMMESMGGKNHTFRKNEERDGGKGKQDGTSEKPEDPRFPWLT